MDQRGNRDVLDRYEARVRVSNVDPGFADLWPSETRGDGAVRRNNANTGGAQGKGTLLRKAPCRLCGFVNDLSAVDHSGGSIDGMGAGGAAKADCGNTIAVQASHTATPESQRIICHPPPWPLACSSFAVVYAIVSSPPILG